jgi:hypothetical protein
LQNQFVVNKETNCYFLVNNDYHFDFINGFIKSLHNQKILIKAPVNINNAEYNRLFDKIINIEFNEFNSLFYLILKPFFIFKKIKKIQSKISPKANDILFLNTDMFLLNHLIVYKFIKCNCKIYLMEDGAATMTYFNMISTHPGFHFKLKELIYNNIYGLRRTSYRKFDHEIMPILDDKIFKGLIVNFGTNTNRSIKIFRIKMKDLIIKDINENNAIFFNQPLYNWYCDFDSYFNFIKDGINIYSELCDNLYIKFHPGDSNKFIDSLTKYICKFKNVIIINNNLNAEKIVEYINVKHAIAINSTSVLNLLKSGYNPIFLNYIFNLKFPSKTGNAFNLLLNNIKCDYPKDFKFIKSLHQINYTHESENHLTINQIIND